MLAAGQGDAPGVAGSAGLGRGCERVKAALTHLLCCANLTCVHITFSLYVVSESTWS